MGDYLKCKGQQLKYDSGMKQFHKNIAENEDAPLISKDSFEVFANTFDESKVKCAYWIKGNNVLHANTFGGLSFKCELHNQNFCDLSKLRSHTAMCCSDYTRCISYRKAMEEMNNVPAEQTDFVPAAAEEYAETFNYAVLSAEMGDYLKCKEQQLKNEYMNFTANCGAIFAEAQEELAKHGFGDNNGMFEKWIESMGFAKPTVYRMISVYNFRSSQIETNEQAQLFDSLSKSLQYEVAKPSAPPELVEQVMNGNITTHKEYIKLKKELDESKSQIENLTKNLENKQDKLKDVVSRYDERIANIVKSNEAKVNELEKQIKALESRPVEATYTSLNDCFDTPADTDDTEKFTSFYETLNHNVLSGIYDCVDFITNTSLPKGARRYARERFKGIQRELENQMMLIEEEF